MKMLHIKALFLGAALCAPAFAHDKSLGPNSTLSFETGKSTLTSEAKQKLKDLVTQARRDGKIDGVQVAAWSDNAAPRPGEELTKNDRDLAERRGKAVQDYLLSMNVRDVDAFNMAERANWLARTYDTAETELKKEVGRGEGLLSKDEYQVFKNNGAPSRAVISVILKGEGT